MTAAGAGALAGAYLLSHFPDRWLLRVPTLATIGFGTSLFAFTLSHTLWLSAACIVAVSLSYMLLSGATNAAIQLHATEPFRGRVISHYVQCFMGMMPWGALAFGIAAARIGPILTLAISGFLVALCGLAISAASSVVQAARVYCGLRRVH